MAQKDIKTRIVDAALHIAEENGWEGVRLCQVAEKLNIPLAGLHGHFRDLDAVADAWLGRGLDAMLASRDKNFAACETRERLRILLLGWFDGLAGHRRVTGQMLAVKMYPPHPHHWAPMIFNLSRLIQWLRDAAGLDAGGRRRQVEEISLTAIFLATLVVWACDGTPDQERTRRFLDRRLGRADKTMACLFGRV
ncbi:MAG TPA: TetR/AcrR family transcriptional regulator [Rhodospirillales bacterium]|jgi:AcrR family transcriptional regulator|nr:TetR/AcrR family transcriptional regulator [Rhodospirillales bacterium]